MAGDSQEAGISDGVAELVRRVGRAFYSDEHVVVLDALSSNVFLRDDELAAVFQLSATQLRRILQQLQQEGLVHAETVKERGRKKGDREAEDAERSGVAGTTVVMSGAEADAAKAAARARRTQRETAITTVCWYINPRWFVDEIRFRVACMNDVMRRRQEDSATVKAMRCPDCGALYSLVEAQAARAGVAAAGSRKAATMAGVAALRAAQGTDRDAVEALAASAAATAATSRPGRLGLASASGGANGAAGLLCGRDGSLLVRLEGVSTGRDAAALSAKWRQQLEETGIPGLLERLARVPLGANRPADHVRENRVSLRWSRAAVGGSARAGGGGGLSIADAAFGGSRRPGQPYGVGAAGREAAAAAARGGEQERGWKPGVFRLEERSVEVRFGDGGRVSEDTLMAAADAAAGVAGAAASLAQAQAQAQRRQASARESAELAALRAMPEHLRRSAVTGERATTLGFVHVQAREGGSAVATKGAEASRAERRALLASRAADVFSSDDDDDDDGDDGRGGGNGGAGVGGMKVEIAAGNRAGRHTVPLPAARALNEHADAEPVTAAAPAEAEEDEDWGDAEDA